MILHTGNRTDIPAFYSKWFAGRLKDGYVLVRSPYNPSLVTRYEINKEVVDLMVVLHQESLSNASVYESIISIQSILVCNLNPLR